jgi:DNA adenine methylase
MASSSPWNGAAPFLRWAGGKRKLVPTLAKFIPEDLNKRRYWEPFLGAGSLFFALRPRPRQAVLLDANEHLIDCFWSVRENPREVRRQLVKHEKNHSREYYYRVREQYNEAHERTCAQAARFIYLNKASFNGIFRVNEEGRYNVPFGSERLRRLPDLKQLTAVSRTLWRTSLRKGDYRDVLAHATKGDFVYLDPPYPPLNGTAYFRHYTKGRFSIEDHEKVAALARKLARRGCIVMISNADTDSIRRLYTEWSLLPVKARRWVSCLSNKQLAPELIITNYGTKGWN